jgi:uncharacterized protein (TIGR02594 family)
MLPTQYLWLDAEPGPRILKEFLKVYGTQEKPGNPDNPTIMWWAKSIGLEREYIHDSIPWCGLTVAYVAAQAGWDHSPRGNALYARNWLEWGTPVDKGAEMLGDVLVFARQGGGHVGLYVGEDATHFHVLGGNQSDEVNIRRKEKSKLLSGRRCPWRINQPPNVRKVMLSAKGEVSGSEA